MWVSRARQQEVRLHRALALQIDLSASLEVESIAQFLRHAFGDMNPAGQGRCLQPACQVDRISPDVVNELVAADDAGDGPSSMDADPDLPPCLTGLIQFRACLH